MGLVRLQAFWEGVPDGVTSPVDAPCYGAAIRALGAGAKRAQVPYLPPPRTRGENPRLSPPPFEGAGVGDKPFYVVKSE